MIRCGAIALVAVLVSATVCAAQQPAPDTSPFGITDNSFLVEESFNQEPRIFQNIFLFTRARHGGWNASFTQEWPVPGVRHQLSFTLPFQRVEGSASVGDLFLNYRYQLSE